ncbi:uncharacterized protein [Coffea arabica]|uniref:Reverse transcriptase domain-containing protein n=1 Tax=Coffea arabica TaxID=13443 RepID=A0ABM4U606_COFAR
MVELRPRGAVSLSSVRGEAAKGLRFEDLRAMQVQLTRRLEQASRPEQRGQNPTAISALEVLLIDSRGNNKEAEGFSRPTNADMCKNFDFVGAYVGGRAVRLCETVCRVYIGSLLCGRIRSPTGQWLTAVEDIKSSAASFFETLFNSDRDTDRHPVLPFTLPSVSREDNESLLALPSLDEVRDVMFSISSDSAPGPDGFGSDFYQACWGIIKEELGAVVQDYFKGGWLPKAVTSTSIVLIPKIAGASRWQDFRPISLCNVSSKIQQAGGLNVPYLAFADDVIVFTRLSRETLEAVGGFFKQYQQYFGQKINAAKSCFVCPSRVTEVQVSLVSNILGFQRQSLPLVYLGVPISHGSCSSFVFDGIIAKVRARVCHWSTRLLSTGEKLILIKHVLNSMPMYLLQVLKPPKVVIVALGKIFNALLWDKAHDSKRIHWASWERLCFPTEKGGLGVRSLNDMVTAFSYKLWWRLRQQGSIWSDFMYSKYIGDHHPLRAEVARLKAEYTREG